MTSVTPICTMRVGVSYLLMGHQFRLSHALSIPLSDIPCNEIKLGLVSTDNVSLTKIICHRNFCNEFAFTHSKDCLYMYYLAPGLSSLTFCHKYLTMKLRHRIEFTRAYFSAPNLLCQRKIVRGNQALYSESNERNSQSIR